MCSHFKSLATRGRPPKNRRSGEKIEAIKRPDQTAPCSTCGQTSELHKPKDHMASGCSEVVSLSPSKLPIGEILSRPQDALPTNAEKRLATSIIKRMLNTSPSSSSSSCSSSTEIVTLPTGGQVRRQDCNTIERDLETRLHDLAYDVFFAISRHMNIHLHMHVCTHSHKNSYRNEDRRVPPVLSLCLPRGINHTQTSSAGGSYIGVHEEVEGGVWSLRGTGG